jgi:acylphosphatase
MVDRFFGFRYEIAGNVLDVGFEKSIQDQAEETGCFGWVQKTQTGTLVGEARCSKRQGPVFQKWLDNGLKSSNGKVDKVDVKVYADTKIRFHFSHFRILEDGRRTCFQDSPHKCGGASAAGAPKDSSKDEL